LLAHHLLVKYLSGSFNDIVDLHRFRNLFWFNHNSILCITEFAAPYLLFLSLYLDSFIFTIKVKGGIASFAKDRISCS